MASSKPAKILFTIPNFITAGSGLLLFSVVRLLDRDRYDPTIAVLEKGGRLEAEIEAENIPIIELPFTLNPRPLWNLPTRAWQVAQPFRPYQFDLWHSFHYSADYTEPIIARLAGAKAWIYTKKNMNWVNRANRAWLVRSFLASRIVADNSTMMETFFDNWWARGKTVLIEHSVDVEKYNPHTEPSLDVRQQLHLSPDDFLIGAVAHVLPVKGYRTLIRSIAHLPSSAHLVIAGSLDNEAYVAELHALIDELQLAERVHFLGRIGGVPQLHAELDAYVLATNGHGRMEGCPVALLEALSCGTPSVATDIPGSKDIIVDGESGLLVPPEDPEAMAQALMRLYNDEQLRRQMGPKGRERILAHYRVEREANELQALYADILR